ncbi:SDR family oxidoreductase [Alkalimonas sp.]|uniref:SDR family NAD(P)-dependent oxidoreductase n=1 Tax=Alkalimonas sp. TaxID=1872453 RepID=UPI00263AA4B1|nr:SDR family oxidoreductase [Alkalimonas sp.]MCC5825013.1 SDR family oxidoreductase [Alkalimonas sp.]
MRIVITGGSKGIGRAIADEFWRRGHQVLVCGQNKDELAALAAAYDHQRFYTTVCNIQQLEQVEALLAKALDCMGGVDIWLNNAGLANTTKSILDTTQTALQSMVTTNVLGTMQCSRVAAKWMQQQGQGKIFTMLGGGSDGEYFAGMGIYGSTKRALDYFTDALAKELAGSGVLVGKIRPGMIITEGVIRESKADLANFERRRRLPTWSAMNPKPWHHSWWMPCCVAVKAVKR